MKKATFFLILLVLFLVVQSQTKVLFLGNSLTSYQPSIFESLSVLAGHDVLVKRNLLFGQALEAHLEASSTLDYIESEDWDYVVLQGSSYAIALPEYHYLIQSTFAQLKSLILTNNPETKIIIFMDWTNNDEVELAGSIYEPDELNELLRTGTIIFADQLDFIVSPVGEAFNYVRKNNTEINCLDADKVHPSNYGSYLAACVYFYIIFGEELDEHLEYFSNIEQDKACLLQDIAEKTVLSNYDYWYILTDSFTVSINDVKTITKQLLIYPNPASYYININSSSLKGEYIIYNSIGNQVASGKIENKTQTIPVNLSNGYYLIRVKQNEEFITKRFNVLK